MIRHKDTPRTGFPPLCPGVGSGGPWESGNGAELCFRDICEFPPGTTYAAVSVAADDVPNVRVLASDRTVLVVNTLDRSISAKFDGKRFPMQAYEVERLDR